MDIKNIIKKILKEERTPTETEVLYWELNPKLIKDLGFDEKYDLGKVYVLEVHFDTKKVVFEIYYGDALESDYISVPIDELPKSVRYFILRRLGDDYLKYI